MNALDKLHLELSTELDELEAAISATTAPKAIMMIARKTAIEELHKRLAKVREAMNNKPALGEADKSAEPPTAMLGEAATTEKAADYVTLLAHAGGLLEKGEDENYVATLIRLLTKKRWLRLSKTTKDLRHAVQKAERAAKTEAVSS